MNQSLNSEMINNEEAKAAQAYADNFGQPGYEDAEQAGQGRARQRAGRRDPIG